MFRQDTYPYLRNPLFIQSNRPYFFVFSKSTTSEIDLDIIVNEVGATKDSTIVYKNGEFYFDTNTIAAFTLTVYDYKQVIT